MKIRSAWSVGLGASALFATTLVHAQVIQDTHDIKISSNLLKQMTQAGPSAKIPALVFLREKADLSGVDNLLTKEDRGRFVYDHLRDTAGRSQIHLIEYLRSRNLRFRSFYIRNAIAVYDASSETLREIAARSDVESVSGNPRVHGIQPRPSTLKGQAVGELEKAARSWIKGTPVEVEPNITSTGAPKAWQEFGAKGKGIVVAGQDTGVDWKHPALKRQYRGATNSEWSSDLWGDLGGTHDYHWHDAIHAGDGNTGTSSDWFATEASGNPCGKDSVEPCDDASSSHGTHTLGTVLGSMASDGAGKATGMAPDAQWIACRNMDNGVGTPATYIECYEYFLAPYPKGSDPLTQGDPSKAPHVINNSWGCPKSEGCEGSEFIPILTAIEKAGIVNVVSAGNEGSGCKTIQDPPAQNTSGVLSVGSINHLSQNISSFSSRGPSALDGGIGPWVTAPGENILSAMKGGRYGRLDGTSMAGPHVAGQVALMLSAAPGLIGKVSVIKQIIAQTAKPRTTTQNCGVPGTQIPNNTYGYGIIDAYAAVKKAKEAGGGGLGGGFSGDIWGNSRF